MAGPPKTARVFSGNASIGEPWPKKNEGIESGLLGNASSCARHLACMVARSPVPVVDMFDLVVGVNSEGTLENCLKSTARAASVMASARDVRPERRNCIQSGGSESYVRGLPYL